MSRARLLAMTVAMAALAAASTACGPSAPRSGAEVRRTVSDRLLSCKELGSLVLLAQSVPSATLLPCVERYPPGWVLDGVPTVRSGFGSFSMSSDIAGTTAVTVALQRTCAVSSATSQDDFSEPDTDHWFENLHAPSPATGYDELQYYRFDGGCVIYRYAFQPGTPGTFVAEVNAALGFTPRIEVARFVKDEFGQMLCGPPPFSCDS